MVILDIDIYVKKNRRTDNFSYFVGFGVAPGEGSDVGNGEGSGVSVTGFGVIGGAVGNGEGSGVSVMGFGVIGCGVGTGRYTHTQTPH